MTLLRERRAWTGRQRRLAGPGHDLLRRSVESCTALQVAPQLQQLLEKRQVLNKLVGMEII